MLIFAYILTSERVIWELWLYVFYPRKSSDELNQHNFEAAKELSRALQCDPTDEQIRSEITNHGTVTGLECVFGKFFIFKDPTHFRRS